MRTPRWVRPGRLKEVRNVVFAGHARGGSDPAFEAETGHSGAAMMVGLPADVGVANFPWISRGYSLRLGATTVP